MKIKVADIVKEDWLSKVAIILMTDQAKSSGSDFLKMFNVEPGMNSDVELKVSINGVEVEFSNFMKVLEEQHEQMLIDKANELIKERGVSKLHDLIDSLEVSMQEKIEQLFPDFQRDKW